MNRCVFTCVAFAGALLAPAFSHAQVSCTREGLQAAVDLYIAAQTKGDTAGLPLAKGLGYVENFKTMNINDGVIRKAMKIDHHRSLLDTSTCQTFTEVIVSDKANPYALGTRLRVNHGLIAEIEMMWTTTGYWGFNVDNYLKYSSAEDWGVIPAAKRDTRATLGVCRQRLSRCVPGREDGSGAVGFPLQPHRRRYAHGQGRSGRFLPGWRSERRQHLEPAFVVDETIGAVVAFCTFGAGSATGGSGAPDTHLFRVENGKLRFVHTLTHLLQANGPGRGAAGKGAPGGPGRGAAPDAPK